MTLQLCSINSGSNGNCYYVGSSNDAVLIDAGISAREIARRMDSAGLDMGRVRALFISHEHSDHIRGVEVFSRRHGIPVYINSRTHRSSRLAISEEHLRYFTSGDEIAVGELLVTSFRKKHDAADPVSFVVSGLGVNVGIFTDIGAPCQQLEKHFRYCHAAFLESNYDETMLRSGPYPASLKKRISGGHGHLSNVQALEFFLRNRTPALRSLVLSHLSAENNDPAVVSELFAPHAGTTELSVASRSGHGPVMEVAANGYRVFRGFTRVQEPAQLTLF